jgi:hypothetical protein
MDKRVRMAEVVKELVSQPFSFMGAGDETRYVEEFDRNGTAP